MVLSVNIEEPHKNHLYSMTILTHSDEFVELKQSCAFEEITLFFRRIREI